MADIYKAGAIIIQDRKLLVTCTKGKDIFILPGGKLEADETYEQALIRELKEELTIDVVLADFEKFGTYSQLAAYDPSKQLEMNVYIVKSWQGNLRPTNEIAEIEWVTSILPEDMKASSICELEVIPKLKELNLID